MCVWGSWGSLSCLAASSTGETWNVPQAIGKTDVNGFMESNPISRGAFFDAFGEVSCVSLCGVEMGAYGKYEFMSAATPVYVGQGNNAIPTRWCMTSTFRDGCGG